MRHIFSLVFILTSLTVFGSVNSKKDSLMNLLGKAKTDTVRIQYYIKIGNVTDDPSKAEYWFMKAVKSCDVLITRGVSELTEEKINRQKAKALSDLASCYQEEEDYISSIIAFNRALACYQKDDDSLNCAITQLENGNNFFRLSQYPEALDNYQKAAEIFNKLDDLRGEAFCCNNIGGIHSEIGNLNLAIEYWTKTLNIKKALKDSFSIAKTMNNLGTVYKSQNNFKQALKTFDDALRIFKSLKNPRGVAMVYSNMSNVFQREKEFEKALRYSRLSLEMKKMIGDETGMALVYGNISAVLNKMGNYVEAKKAAENGIDLALKTGALAALKNNYSGISLAYAGLKNKNQAYAFLLKYETVKDSLFNIEKNKEFARLEMQYQVKSKEQEIEKQQEIIKKKEAIAEKNRTERNAMFGGIVLMVLLLMVVLYSYIQKRKDNSIIREKNQNLEIANAEILAQRDEIEAQRDLVDMQKKQIEYIHGELKDSIVYGKRIQQSLLPSDVFLNTFFDKNYFVLNRPRDLVSGDFYWAAQVDEWKFFTVADCTGHGVPGAFMSMLGISLLNEIVRERNIRTTTDLLTLLFSRLSQNLHRRQGKDALTDSMDIVFCAWNTKTNELQYSGINNPLYLIRDNALQVILPTKMINIESIQDKEILMETIVLQKGDFLILSSDGFADQFGGEKGKKFKKKNFQKLLTSLTDYSIQEHQEKLEKAFLNWKGVQDQVDDVCVMGVKFDNL
ncbi:MAG: tetratricopeptide repeat protein [Bacteroidales bacterium]|nr:tetratricopeptide repeat protein [Bacteroidales bacterium]